jgi:hypothetical protein
MAIDGKVAAILNDRELVINKGKNSGVKAGMIFGILEEREIEDPDTKEELGSVEIVKIRVKVVDVKPKMSICRTYETYNFNLGGSGQLRPVPGLPWLGATTVAELFYEPSPNWVTKVKTLNPKANEEGAVVDIGDRVRQLEKETE